MTGFRSEFFLRLKLVSLKLPHTMTFKDRLDEPISAKRIEWALDRLAEIMVRLCEEGQKCLPIYKRLEAELATYRAQERDMVAVGERAKRLKTQRAHSLRTRG
ncbi:hypothetical protein [Rhizobium laguerreae]|uniref:hypothetical protein n=1 Tax=Rhizobium laguerreae TaxID=1076926 RepID=UPI00143F5142|nr:hypothetical protein [Rhizobium laguerreae]